MGTFLDQHYEILGVLPHASLEEIKRAYRKRAKECHSDTLVGTDPSLRESLEKEIRLVNKAWWVLSNKDRRREYDEICAALAQIDVEVASTETTAAEKPTLFTNLNSTINVDEFVSQPLQRNSGHIVFYGSAFSATYFDMEGELHTLPKMSANMLGPAVENSRLRQHCIFRPITGAMDPRQTTSGHTFVTDAITGADIRWLISDDIWSMLQTSDRRRTKSSNHPPAKSQAYSDQAHLRDIVTADLRHGGVLSESLSGYEERTAQITMAQKVADALERGDHLVVEAGTGTGKSLAYLLPIVRSGKVAIVSTANKALQEQLFYKDIPFVQEHVMPFDAALVKGMGNYLCLDRLAEEEPFQQIVRTPAFAAMESRLGNFDEWNGDLDLLTESLPGDVRGRIAAESELCAWRECPHFGPCYVREMRERSRRAQIIVVNHTLLLLDAAMEGFLLPERDVIVIDEAHHLEEEATRAFTITVSPGRVTSLLAQRRLRENTDPRVFQDAQAAFSQAWDALERVARPDAKGRQHLVDPLQDGLHLASAIDDVATSLQRGRPLSLDDKEEQLYEKLVKRTRSLAADLRVVFGVADPANRVYYLERSGGYRRRESQLSASAAPLAVGNLLREKLFDRIPTIATSATLAVNRSFSFFRSRVGIPAGGQDVVLPLTFDYASQALLYVPRLKFEPAFGAASGPYLDEMAQEMRQLVEASDGRAFLLFSSMNALEGVLKRIGDTLEDDGYNVLVQGRDMGRIELLKQFRERPRAVLFGLKSFWEGVDVVGDALSLVVIDKLPFDPPDDPVNEARINQMKAAGENWFGGYTLPQAILRLKQGLGRLLRSHEDRGVLAILDKRLHTKSYGREVLAALPPARRTIQIADVQHFFADDAEMDNTL